MPVDGFWSISLYNADGYFQKNDLNAYSLNNITSKKSADGSVAIQFGGCDGKIPNCLPIMNGWNYTVRLYRPRAEILNGKWKFRSRSQNELKPRLAPMSGYWPGPEVRQCLLLSRYWAKSGIMMLIVSSSATDPKRSSTVQSFCVAGFRLIGEAGTTAQRAPALRASDRAE